MSNTCRLARAGTRFRTTSPMLSAGARTACVLPILAILTALAAPAGAQVATQPAEAPAQSLPAGEGAAAPAKPSKPGNWFEAWKQFKSDMEKTTGTGVSLTLDNHVQFIANGPGEGHERDLFWFNLMVTQKLWPGARLVARARGDSDRHEPIGGIRPLVGSRLDLDWMAYETEWIYLANLYLEQKLFDDKLLLAVGKMHFGLPFDANAVAGWDFLSLHLARSAAFPHRFHTIGALAKYDVTDWFYAMAGIMDAQGRRSETGLNTAFHGEDYFTNMYEFGFKTRFFDQPGNYRFNLWYDPQPLRRHDGTGFERDNLGFGLNFDQMLTKKVGTFLRYGWNDADVRTFGNYWSLGGTWTGLIPGRDKDVAAIGFGQGITGHDFRRARHATSQESIFETYYKVTLTEWCSLFFHLQTVLNPGTNPDNDVSVIPGIRLKLDF